MDSEAQDKLVNELYEIRELIDSAWTDHPMDDRLEEAFERVTKILEDYE